MALTHDFDDGELPFCADDDCVACALAELQCWKPRAFTAQERNGPAEEPFYIEVPGDPTDRAAFYARLAPAPMPMPHSFWSAAIRATLRHDSPYIDYDA